jgi:hypothetical protein
MINSFHILHKITTPFNAEESEDGKSRRVLKERKETKNMITETEKYH